jgi:hypothetical protein
MSTEDPPEAPRGPGRPALAPEEARDQFLRIRLTKAELDEIKAAAGTKTSDWARTRLLAAAKRAKPKP